MKKPSANHYPMLLLPLMQYRISIGCWSFAGMKTLYSRHLLASLLVISRKSTCTCMYGLTNLLACTHHSCVVSPPADQHGMLSSPTASSIAADISPARHEVIVGAHRVCCGGRAWSWHRCRRAWWRDDGVRLGQHTLDVGAGGTTTDDDEEPHLPSSLSANMVMLLSAKLKWATKVLHAWLRWGIPTSNFRLNVFLDDASSHRTKDRPTCLLCLRSFQE